MREGRRLVKVELRFCGWLSTQVHAVNTTSVEFTSSPCCDSTAADNLRSFNRELA